MPVPSQPVFLTAEWRNLAMLNYEIDPAVLRRYVPAGCELDDFQGRTFVSIVGFQFLSTRVLGFSIPFHRNFEEVNLRFYVTRRWEGGWRRGVVFIKELVKRPAISWVARNIYGENYQTLPMRNLVEVTEHGQQFATYQWKHRGEWEGIVMSADGIATVPSDDSEESFIIEHYWGYSRQPDGSAVEYEVQHPPWSIRRAVHAKLTCDAARLYGADFAPALAGPCSSAFLADGSAVVVHKGQRLR